MNNYITNCSNCGSVIFTEEKTFNGCMHCKGKSNKKIKEYPVKGVSGLMFVEL